ncbi:MAG TPA: hypothetical protein VNH42_03700 [Mariprofundaceae bacterium]|nr:hypothetical protein [Mariprofundaceae bacterium]
MASSDISWPDLTPPPINLWSLARGFEQAARRHPMLILRRRQLMQHLQQMQQLLVDGDGADDGEGQGGEGI